MPDAVQPAQRNLPMDKPGNYVIPMPTGNERKEMLLTIPSETQRLDSTISIMERCDELLKNSLYCLYNEKRLTF